MIYNSGVSVLNGYCCIYWISKLVNSYVCCWCFQARAITCVLSSFSVSSHGIPPYWYIPGQQILRILYCWEAFQYEQCSCLPKGMIDSHEMLPPNCVPLKRISFVLPWMAASHTLLDRSHITSQHKPIRSTDKWCALLCSLHSSWITTPFFWQCHFSPFFADGRSLVHNPAKQPVFRQYLPHGMGSDREERYPLFHMGWQHVSPELLGVEAHQFLVNVCAKNLSW